MLPVFLLRGIMCNEPSFNCCEDWGKGITGIVAQQTFCANQAAAPEYIAPIFRYCPWCGHKLALKDFGNNNVLMALEND